MDDWTSTKFQVKHVISNDRYVSKQKPKRSYRNKKFVPICHHCGRHGHIRPKCYDLLYPEPTTQNDVKTRAIWVKKSNLRCHVIHIALKAQ